MCWSAPASPDRVLASTPLEVLFQSDFVKRGSSGGALFDRWWELVGVVTTSDPPRASAIPIDYVIEQAETWGIPVSIHRPGIPRAGYRTTIGAAILSPTASLSDRFPSSRFDITYMLKYPVSVHAGYLRLAPGELDGCPESNDPNLDTLLAVRAPCEMVMNSVVAGVGANLVWRRLTLRVFGEGGLGLVQGRFDQGGIFVQDPQLTYVPNPKSTDETTTFIGGVGVIAEYTIFPRAILQALGGYWAYNGDPFVNEPLFPDEFTSFSIPHLFFGVGLKLGL